MSEKKNKEKPGLDPAADSFKEDNERRRKEWLEDQERRKKEARKNRKGKP